MVAHLVNECRCLQLQPMHTLSSIHLVLVFFWCNVEGKESEGKWGACPAWCYFFLLFVSDFLFFPHNRYTKQWIRVRKLRAGLPLLLTVQWCHGADPQFTCKEFGGAQYLGIADGDLCNSQPEILSKLLQVCSESSATSLSCANPNDEDVLLADDESCDGDLATTLNIVAERYVAGCDGRPSVSCCRRGAWRREGWGGEEEYIYVCVCVSLSLCLQLVCCRVLEESISMNLVGC